MQSSRGFSSSICEAEREERKLSCIVKGRAGWSGGDESRRETCKSSQVLFRVEPLPLVEGDNSYCVLFCSVEWQGGMRGNG